MEISAKDVAELRRITGAGMMDCKVALTESKGNIELAIKEIRKKGQKVAANRSDRDAKEGIALAGISTDSKKGAIFALNCETDFVAKNHEFVQFANDILKTAIQNNITTIETLMSAKINQDTIENKVIDFTGKIGEKIKITSFSAIHGEHIAAYNHFTHKLSALVSLNKSNNIATDLAMQIAAMAPIAIDEKGISASIIDTEKEVIQQQLKNEGIKTEMIDKVMTGKLAKFVKENCLLTQAFVKNEKQSVATLLSETDKDLKINSFKRVSLG